MGNRIFVGNLSFDSTEDSIVELFEQDSRRVERVNIVTDRETGRPRGFAFVDMGSEADAQSAIKELDGVELDGRPLRVNEADSKPSRGGGGGGNRGRRDW